jgi:hypothetical protein
MVRNLSAILVAVPLSLAAGAAARADDVTDQINEALKAYEKHDYSTAATALEAAATLVHQARAEIWKGFLPEALSGWTAEDAEASAAGAAMLGGGTTISRRYRKDSQAVEISFVSDSPLVQAMGAVLGSGMIAGADMKLIVIDGRKVTYRRTRIPTPPWSPTR